MKNNRIIIAVFVVILLVIGGAFWKLRRPKAQPIQTGSQANAIPDFEIYRQLFHHHVTMKQKADELEKKGKDGKFLREFYKRRANLDDEEAQALDDIATDCEKANSTAGCKSKGHHRSQLSEEWKREARKGRTPA